MMCGSITLCGINIGLIRCLMPVAFPSSEVFSAIMYLLLLIYFFIASLFYLLSSFSMCSCFFFFFFAFLLTEMGALAEVYPIYPISWYGLVARVCYAPGKAVYSNVINCDKVYP